MKLSLKAQAALDRAVERFKNGDLSPIVEVVAVQPQEGMPSSKWSLGNRILVYAQTGTLDCRGYRQWQEVGRQVKKGSTAASILVPRMVTVEDDEAGGSIQVLKGFLSAAVFPVHDTEGQPLPEIDYTPRELPPLTDVAERLGVEVNWTSLPGDRLGSCNPTGTNINIGTHDASVFFHELAHAAHARINGELKRGQHADQETVAEFTAMVLMAIYGLGDRTGNAWHYIQMYSPDPILALVKALSDIEKVLGVLLEEG